MTKAKVLLLGTIDHARAREDWDSLASIAETVTPKAENRKDFIEECNSGRFDGVIAIYRTFPSVSITGRFDPELVNHLPKSVKFVCHNGAGYDQVDVPACSARGIYVSNVPTAVDAGTADTAVYLILGALRGFNAPTFALRTGHFRGNPAPPYGHDPEGKVLGILGMGGIGRNLARKMRAFDMKIIYYNRKKLDDSLADGAEYVSLEELLRESDVISLNLPLNPQTHHMISKPQFELMKPSVVIVNTARGAVMDEAALVEALDSGKVASVGLDVFEEEPKIHPGLLQNDKVTLLPHMGTWSIETQIAIEQWCIGNVRAALETGKLKSRVVEQAKMTYE